MAKYTFVGGIHPFDGKKLSKDKPITSLKAGKELQKVNHPDEGAFTDFDNLSDPAVEGF